MTREEAARFFADLLDAKETLKGNGILGSYRISANESFFEAIKIAKEALDMAISDMKRVEELETAIKKAKEHDTAYAKGYVDSFLQFCRLLESEPMSPNGVHNAAESMRVCMANIGISDKRR